MEAPWTWVIEEEAMMKRELRHANHLALQDGLQCDVEVKFDNLTLVIYIVLLVCCERTEYQILLPLSMRLSHATICQPDDENITSSSRYSHVL